MYRYGDKEFRTSFVKRFTDDKESWNEEMFFSKFGSLVWEFVFNNDQNIKTQTKMLHQLLTPKLVRFKYPNKESSSIGELRSICDDSSLKALDTHIDTFINRCLDKELFSRIPMHFALKILTTGADATQLEELAERCTVAAEDLLTTREGTQALIQLSGHASAKQRKVAVRAVKGKAVEMSNNKVNHLFVIRLLKTVDDTKLLQDSILKDICADIAEVSFNNFGRKVLTEVLSDQAPSSLNKYSADLLALPSPKSLKPAAQRRAEVSAPLVAALCEAVMAAPINRKDGWRGSRGETGKPDQDLLGRKAFEAAKELPASAAGLLDWCCDSCAGPVLVELCFAMHRKDPKDDRVQKRLVEALQSEMKTADQATSRDWTLNDRIGKDAIIRLVVALPGFAARLWAGVVVGLPSAAQQQLLEGVAVFVLIKLLSVEEGKAERCKSASKLLKAPLQSAIKAKGGAAPKGLAVLQSLIAAQ
eukprot:Selendium_serpulae@DN1698_c0_g1_i1.p1